MITRLLARWADAALRTERDYWRARARRAERELSKAEAAIDTLHAVCDRYSASMAAASQRLRQMREGQ